MIIKLRNYFIKGFFSSIICLLVFVLFTPYIPFANGVLSLGIIFSTVFLICIIWYIISELYIFNYNESQSLITALKITSIGLFAFLILTFSLVQKKTLRLLNNDIIVIGDYTEDALLIREKGLDDLELYDAFLGNIEDIWDDISFYSALINLSFGATLLLLSNLTSGLISILFISKRNNPKKQSKQNVTNKVLFLASNPLDTTKLNLEKEFIAISTELQNSHLEFQLVHKWGVTKKQISEFILNEQPSVVHFSGHGGEIRDRVDTNDTHFRGLSSLEGEYNYGIVLENENGESETIKQKALSDLFELFADSIKCVVLNSCYSKYQAKIIATHIPFVIGMDSAIPDSTAILFSTSFYKALNKGKTVEFAYNFAKTAIEIENPDFDYPVLFTKTL